MNLLQKILELFSYILNIVLALFTIYDLLEKRRIDREKRKVAYLEQIKKATEEGKALPPRKEKP